MSPLNEPQVFETTIMSCSRCGEEHRVMALPFTRPFAPVEANGLVWTHWSQCPKLKEPILIMVMNGNR